MGSRRFLLLGPCPSGFSRSSLQILPRGVLHLSLIPFLFLDKISIIELGSLFDNSRATSAHGDITEIYTYHHRSYFGAPSRVSVPFQRCANLSLAFVPCLAAVLRQAVRGVDLEAAIVRVVTQGHIRLRGAEVAGHPAVRTAAVATIAGAVMMHLAARRAAN